MNRPTTTGRIVRGAFFGAVAVAAISVAGSGCLDRPVAPATPLVSARVVELAKQNKVNKIDLLFMIDNSSSMADKQQILGEAVPELVDRLIEPKCIDPLTLRTVGNAVNGVCAMGELDFEPIKDIHIGIVSSSVGNHGANGVCEDNIDVSLGRTDPHNNDQAHLISRGIGGTPVPTFNNKGFLFYNPSAPGGLIGAKEVATPFTDMVKGVGQHGCGYEASLEAIYRFLIDPDPYGTIRIDTSIGGFGQALLNGTDMQLLQQRADFLRADSLVSIMIVTDENDCSVVDGGQGFYALLPPVAGTGRSVLKPGTSRCKDNPNDKCCFNCGQQSPPPGCGEAAGDPECQKGELLVSEDQPNLRCFDQKRRYGVDFLYDVQRYIDGFTKDLVPNRKNEMVPNPLLSDLTCKPGTMCTAMRDKALIFVAGITGVPWQDIAIDDKDLTKGYKTAKQIEEDNVWAEILGDPKNLSGPVPPRDTHMVESIKPRAGLPVPGSGANADVKHGHEWDPSKDMSQPNADLQYACTFPLITPKMCTEAADCDCFGPNIGDVQNPLCQDPASGAYSSLQRKAKAYPGTRVLQVLRGLDAAQAIVASICPANVTDKGRDDYGYSPAIRALVGRLRNALRGRCLPRTLEVDPTTGNVPCVVVEVFNDAKCNCNNEPGRKLAEEEVITEKMRAEGNCFCEIKQLIAEPQRQCKTNLNVPANTGDGWCYVDPSQGPDPANPFDMAQCAVVRSCPATDKRLIKFINTNSEPRPGATAFIMCQEKSFPSNGGQGANQDMKCN
ncbi:MAG TPA: hypothetical protein VK550_05380 [Polyangiaceae bacterium]|nr:hypothetical protein [Polyangiaceae bacterium]